MALLLLPVVAAPADGPCRMRLTGLPSKICANRAYVEAMLEQAGFEDEVVDFRIGSGADTGELDISFASLLTAYSCVAHFISCFWGSAPVQIQAEIRAISKEREPACGEASGDESASTDDPGEDSPCSESSSGVKSSEPERVSAIEGAETRPECSGEHASLCVAYFPKVAMVHDLQITFSKFGKITLANIMRDRNGVSKCFGFVNFEKRSAAEAALRACETGSVTMRDFGGKKWHVKASWAESCGPTKAAKQVKRSRPSARAPEGKTWPAPSDASARDSNVVETQRSVTAEGKGADNSLRPDAIMSQRVWTNFGKADKGALRGMPRWSDIDSDDE